MRVLRAARACLLRDDDLRSAAAHDALARIVAVAEGGRVVSVGGGPMRAHPRFLNLNIQLFANVDLVATAYALPFRDATVDGIHCEAVLEHLEFPDEAVAEMFRALKPGGTVYAATPFLQSYHGHPDHFQNFTLSGHLRLFERAGFLVERSGPCVGPTFVMTDITTNYAREFLPGLAGRALARATRVAGRLMRLFDIGLSSHRNAAHLCSSTFVLAKRP